MRGTDARLCDVVSAAEDDIFHYALICKFLMLSVPGNGGP